MKSQIRIDDDEEYYLIVQKENFELKITHKHYNRMGKTHKEKLKKYIANNFDDMLNGKIRKTL